MKFKNVCGDGSKLAGHGSVFRLIGSGKRSLLHRLGDVILLEGLGQDVVDAAVVDGLRVAVGVAELVDLFTPKGTDVGYGVWRVSSPRGDPELRCFCTARRSEAELEFPSNTKKHSGTMMEAKVHGEHLTPVPSVRKPGNYRISACAIARVFERAFPPKNVSVAWRVPRVEEGATGEISPRTCQKHHHLTPAPPPAVYILRSVGPGNSFGTQ